MAVDPQLEKSWLEALRNEFDQPYFEKLKSFLLGEKKSQLVYPPGPKIFEALNATPLNEVKVVILGQDPYHGPDQANGLCFSVNPGIKFPPSLNNIFKELNADINMDKPSTGDLSNWAQQGVLLLNSVLTVRAHQAASHKNQGWEKFTDAVIQKVSESQDNVVFLLWGNYAKNKVKHIDLSRHHILQSAHPSPLSAHNGFFGNRHFSKTNDLLISFNKTPIKWDAIA
ncbi:MAG: uracil-DNA glycosylase [Schleiferiaceae bacterium]|nr:uracil-DNA glycosylase [Schleiferiaceae bacterium]